MSKALLIPSDITKACTIVDISDAPDSEGLDIEHAVFDGQTGPLDFATWMDRRVQFAYDDIGLYREDAAEAINTRAMRLWAHLAGMSPEDFTTPLVGNFLALGVDPRDGEMTDVPMEVVAYITTVDKEVTR